jgi:hypothetical protein
MWCLECSVRAKKQSTLFRKTCIETNGRSTKTNSSTRLLKSTSISPCRIWCSAVTSPSQGISRATLATIVVSLVIIIAVVGYATISYLGTQQPTSITCSEATTTFYAPQNGTTQALAYPIPVAPCMHQLSLSGFSLTARTNTLSGTLRVNSRSPITGLLIYVNGSYQTFNALSLPSSSGQYSLQYTASLANSTISIVAGNSYLVEFVGIFKDGTATTASVAITASS